MVARDTYRPVKPGQGATSLDAPSSFRNQPCTVAEAIVARMAAGSYLEPACAASGVSTNTVYGWLRSGTEARRRVEAAEADGDRQAALDALTPHQRACMHFAVDLEVAESTWLEYAETQLDAICRGGQVAKKRTVKKNAYDEITEIVEVTEEIPVDPRVLMWRMERRYPALYGRRAAEPPKPEASTKIAIVDAGELAAKLAKLSQPKPAGVLEVNGTPALEAAQ